MDVYRELEIRGERSTVEAFMSAVSAGVGSGWADDHDSDDAWDYRFTYSDGSGRPSAKVYLKYREDSTVLYATNVIPQDRQSLEVDEYNAILEEFHQQLTALNSLGLTIDLSKASKTLEDYLSPGTAKKLEAFSNAANKSTGSSHPYDQERWFDFLVDLHKDRPDFDGTTLKRWLLDNGWSDDTASDLIIEYEFAQALLSFYDRHQ